MRYDSNTARVYHVINFPCSSLLLGMAGMNLATSTSTVKFHYSKHRYEKAGEIYLFAALRHIQRKHRLLSPTLCSEQDAYRFSIVPVACDANVVWSAIYFRTSLIERAWEKLPPVEIDDLVYNDHVVNIG